jgi:hypothetical protein
VIAKSGNVVKKQLMQRKSLISAPGQQANIEN